MRRGGRGAAGAGGGGGRGTPGSEATSARSPDAKSPPATKTPAASAETEPAPTTLSSSSRGRHSTPEAAATLRHYFTPSPNASSASRAAAAAAAAAATPSPRVPSRAPPPSPPPPPRVANVVGFRETASRLVAVKEATAGLFAALKALEREDAEAEAGRRKGGDARNGGFAWFRGRGGGGGPRAEADPERTPSVKAAAPPASPAPRASPARDRTPPPATPRLASPGEGSRRGSGSRRGPGGLGGGHSGERERVSEGFRNGGASPSPTTPSSSFSGSRGGGGGARSAPSSSTRRPFTATSLASPSPGARAGLLGSARDEGRRVRPAEARAPSASSASSGGGSVRGIFGKIRAWASGGRARASRERSERYEAVAARHRRRGEDARGGGGGREAS